VLFSGVPDASRVPTTLQRRAVRLSDGSAFHAFEEDTDWAIPAMLVPGIAEGLARQTGEPLELLRGVADQTLRDRYPDEYEDVMGVRLTAAQSHTLAQREFDAAHADDYVTRAAWGDWHHAVPTGFVGVLATRRQDGDDRWFLVPASEYQHHRPSSFKFVVDVARHVSCPPLDTPPPRQAVDGHQLA